MRLVIDIPHDGTIYRYFLFDNCDFQVIDFPNVVILEITKVHDHRYVLCGFFYRTKVILRPCSYGTKKKLYDAIQKLLQEYL